MFLQIRKLMQNDAVAVKATCEINLQQQDFQGYKVLEPIKVNYLLQPEHGAVKVCLKAKALISGECARCLKPVEEEWRFAQEFLVTPKNLAEEFPELPFNQHGELNINTLVHEELILDISGGLLCNENCEGLCSACGEMRSNCKCENDGEALRATGDPRMQVLRQLLTQENDE